MPNPFGITEVDIPGVLGAYQNQQDRRLQQMLATRQIAAADREQERADKVTQAWAKFQQGRGGSNGAQGGAAGAVGAYGAPPPPDAAGQPAAALQQAPEHAAYDPWHDSAAQDELVNSLMVLDPAQAAHLREAFSGHSKEEREVAAGNWKQIGSAAFQLRQLPPDQRPAAFQSMIPMLRSLHIGEDVLQQVDLSDQGLENAINQSRDIENVIKGSTPSTLPVSGVGVFPVTPGSPYPDFSNGGARPEAQIGEVTVIENDAGEQMILQNGAWVPVGGGGGNAPGGFPQP